MTRTRPLRRSTATLLHVLFHWTTWFKAPESAASIEQGSPPRGESLESRGLRNTDLQEK